MSVKIYNGFKLTLPGTLKDFISKVNDFRKELIEIADYSVTKLAIEKATQIYDNLTILSEEDNISPWDIINNQFREYRNKPHERNIVTDFLFEMTLMPLDNNTYLGIYYCDYSPFVELLFERFDEIQEYGYWDNTDQPEHLSDEEWTLRRSEWDAVLLQHDPAIPSHVGFTISLITKPSWEGVVIANHNIPSYEIRKQKCLENVAFTRFAKEHKDLQNIGDIWFKYVDFLKTGDGEKFLNEIHQEIDTKLNKELQVSDLFNKFSRQNNHISLA